MKPINNTRLLVHSNTLYEANRYVMLLQRLDEEEGLSEPSIEEKLKLAEDHLRLSCLKFCEASSTLFDGKSIREGTKLDAIEVQTVQELFQAKSFKPSFRPPKSELRSLNNERGNVACSKSTDNEIKKDYLSKAKWKQAYYLPPSTWFSSEKCASDLSSEEVELLSSCATKTFVRFLEEKKKEIPKIFSICSEISQEINRNAGTYP